MFDLLKSAIQHPFLWIGAPPGYGKTTLMTSFIHEREATHLWFRMSVNDEHPCEFLRHLVEGIRTLSATHQAEVPSLTHSSPIDAAQFLLRLIPLLPSPLLIVFDNYSLLAEDSKVHELLSGIDEDLPPEVCMVFLSHNPPPPAFARCLANQRMSLLSTEQMRFTQEETYRLLAQRSGKNGDPEPWEDIHRLSQGWAAGICLLHKSGVAGKVQHPLPIEDQLETVFDYFAHEIFRRLDYVHRSLLFHAAILEQIHPSILAPLAQVPHAEEILNQLERDGCFIHRSDVAEHYELHPLFRRFLIQTGRKTLTRKQWRETHHRAARLCLAENLRNEAFACLMEAEEFDQALELLDEFASHDDSFRKIHPWLKKFPPEWQRSSPRLLYWRALELGDERPDTALKDLDRAYRMFMDRRDPSGAAHSCLGAIDVLTNHLGRFDCLPRWLERLHSLHENSAETFSEIRTEMTLALFQGYLFHNPRITDFSAWSEDLVQLLHSEISHPLWCQVCHAYLLFEYWNGHFPQAQMWLERLRMRCEEWGSPPELEILCHSFSATLSWHYHMDSELTLSHVRQGLACIEKNSLLWPKAPLYSNLVSAHISQGNAEAAHQAFETFKQFIRTDSPQDLFSFHHHATLMALLDKDPNLAAAHVNETLHWGKQCGTLFHRGIAYVDAGHVTLVNQQLETTEKYLLRAVEIAATMNSDLLGYECSLLRACLHLRRGEPKLYREVLHETLRLGHSHGIRTFLLGEPGLMGNVYHDAMKMGLETAYVRQIVQLRNLSPPSEETPFWPWPLRIQTLGPFTIEKDGEKLSLSPNSKPLRLLKALITCGSHDVNVTLLSEILWPEAEGDAAHESFKVTLRRLRHFLGSADVLILKHNCVTLNPQVCWCDVDAFRTTLKKIDLRHGEERLELMETAFSIYQGSFLEEDDTFPVTHKREKLLGQYQHLTLELGSCYEDVDLQQAVDCYEKALSIHDTLELLSQRLIRCHLQMNRKDLAMEVYQRCCNSLQRIGSNPSEQTRRLLET